LVKEGSEKTIGQVRGPADISHPLHQLEEADHDVAQHTKLC